MPLACSKEALAWLFLNATSTFKLLFFFSFLLSDLASNLLSSFCRYNQEYDHGALYDDEGEEEEEGVVAVVEEEEEEEVEFGYYSNALQTDHLVADIIDGGGGLVFRSQSVASSHHDEYRSSSSDDPCQFEDLNEEEEEKDRFVVAEAEEEEVVLVEDITGREDSYLDENLEPEQKVDKHKCSSPITIDLSKKQELSIENVHNSQGNEKKESREIEHLGEGRKLARDDKFLAFPRGDQTKKSVVGNGNTLLDHQRRHVGRDGHEDEPNADSCTVGSTSKDSSEWRSSITFRDSVTEDPFSSSSRRSCPKWESYTMFQRYDEEMMFLDRISAQKLHETESLKSFKVQPRSISQRIAHQIATTASRSKRPQDGIYHNNPFHELEAAYVAQICLAWEALSWDYNNFHRKQSLRKQQGMKSDPGCSALVAQQFQQFQVLLQRYIENEPYEYGKRPEVYARMRTSVAPKLLLVPEYQDNEDDQREQQGASSRIPSGSFLDILEESIRTFMSFLRADKENRCQAVLRALFRRRKRGSVDPALIKVMRKTNRKKKLKLKDLQRPGSCMRKKKVTWEEEMEILMGLIDLKVVSRVLRMWDLTHEQLRWCEEKMTKLSLSKQGKLHRDATPLFFPAH